MAYVTTQGLVIHRREHSIFNTKVRATVRAKPLPADNKKQAKQRLLTAKRTESQKHHLFMTLAIKAIS